MCLQATLKKCIDEFKWMPGIENGKLLFGGTALMSKSNTIISVAMTFIINVRTIGKLFRFITSVTARY